MSEIFARLAAPFPPEAVSWRVGSMSKDKSKAKALAYIDARDVMRRLDVVCGQGGWQCEYTPMANGTTCCRIGIKVDGEWVWKANGAGATDVEGEKGAYSDAFKRAAVLWGVGQYLYDLDSPWVRVNEWKQIEKDELPRLTALLGKVPGPAAEPPDVRLYKILRQCRTIGELQDFWKREQPAIRDLPHDTAELLTAEKDRLKASLMKVAA